MSMINRLLGRSVLLPVAAAIAPRIEPVLSAAAPMPAGAAEAGFRNIGFYDGQSRVRGLPPVSPQTAQRHATVYACGNVIAGDLSKVPLLVWQRNKDGSEGAVADHPATYLMNVEAAPGVPAKLARYLLAYAFAIRGRAYAYAPRDGAGELEMIDVLHPDLVAEGRRGRERFYSFTDGDEVQRQVPSRAMLHLRYMADDGWTGRSPLQVAAESIGLALAGQEAAARSASGTHMRAFVKMDGFFDDEEAAQRSAVRLRGALTDPENKGIPIIENGELKSLDMSAADQELLASRKFDREQIMSLFRVPPFKLQLMEYGIKASGQQQAIDYKTDCLTHWGGHFEGFAAMTLLTEAERRAGLTLVHDWEALLEPTTSELFAALRVATGGPMMTVEEARHRAGLGPKKETDTLYPPSNMTAPAGSLGKEKEQEDA